MATISVQPARRIAGVVALCAGFASLAPSPADARVWVGIGIPFGGFYPAPYYYPPPPPVYYPPPPVYAPPPVVYAPPQSYSPVPAGAGQACYAGPYVCPMDRPVATGGSCYCLGNGGQHVWGRAN